jgi:uncharacterized protein
MLFAVICTDKPNAVDLRMKTRPAHLEFLKTIRTLAGGPFTDEAGSPTGSLLIVEAVDLADAKSKMVHDPYALAGLFQSVEIRPWKWLINAPVGE